MVHPLRGRCPTRGLVALGVLALFLVLAGSLRHQHPGPGSFGTPDACAACVLGQAAGAAPIAPRAAAPPAEPATAIPPPAAAPAPAVAPLAVAPKTSPPAAA